MGPYRSEDRGRIDGNGYISGNCSSYESSGNQEASQNKLLVTQRRRVYTAAAFAAIVILGSIFAIFLLGHEGRSSGITPQNVQKPAATHQASSNDIPQEVQQPPTASQVAASLGCTGFENDEETGGTDMVVSDGTCMKDGTKYAIDTFVSRDVRDAWLKAAEPLGVKPAWETATSVTYPSVSGQ